MLDNSHVSLSGVRTNVSQNILHEVRLIAYLSERGGVGQSLLSIEHGICVFKWSCLPTGIFEERT